MKPSLLADSGFDIQVRSHVEAVLVEDFPVPLRELCKVLADFRTADVELIKGGGEASSTRRLRRALTERGWQKRSIEMSKIVDGELRAGITHEIDHVRQTDKGALVLEIEWNNKDTFLSAIWKTSSNFTRKEQSVLG